MMVMFCVKIISPNPPLLLKHLMPSNSLSIRIISICILLLIIYIYCISELLPILNIGEELKDNIHIATTRIGGNIANFGPTLNNINKQMGNIGPGMGGYLSSKEIMEIKVIRERLKCPKPIDIEVRLGWE